MDKIAQLESALETLKAEYHAKSQSLTTSEVNAYGAKIKELMLKVQAAYVEGCKPLNGVMPIGSRIAPRIDGKMVRMWCIGTGPLHEVKSESRATAVAMWNVMVDSQ